MKQARMILLAVACSYHGKKVAEIPGPQSDPTISQWITQCEALHPTDLPRDDSKYAWCGVFVGGCMMEAMTLGAILPAPPAYYQRAKAWAAWGKEVSLAEAEAGDVLVCRRGKGLYHVCIIMRVTESHALVVGGNQSNAVTEMLVPHKDIHTLRRA